ncbi:MAG: amidoligase family protein [Candidatus Peribacteraceae bacterium]|nr:amidoligase family protein [Candidatus Peribacteraceae bacterium]
MSKQIKLSDVTGIHPDTRTHNPTRELVLPRCSIGVEVELENITNMSNATSNLDLWNLETDGSLRNNGMEFISKVVRGADIITALTQLEDTLKRRNPQYEPSSRTSVHIHIDVRNYTVDKLLNLCVVYAIFERALFNYVGEERAYSNFCVPFYQSDGAVRTVSLINSDSAHNISVGLSTPKYTALNLAPSRTQGSVEFRQHAGTANKVELLKWINILMSLKRYVNNYNGTSQDIIDSVCEKGVTFYKDVFREHLPVYNESRLVKDMVAGARVAQEILYTNIRKHKGKNRPNQKESLFYKLNKDNIRKDWVFPSSNAKVKTASDIEQPMNIPRGVHRRADIANTPLSGLSAAQQVQWESLSRTLNDNDTTGEND